MAQRFIFAGLIIFPTNLILCVCVGTLSTLISKMSWKAQITSFVHVEVYIGSSDNDKTVIVTRITLGLANFPVFLGNLQKNPTSLISP